MTTSDSNYPVSFLNTSEVFPEDDEQLRIKLTDVYQSTASAMNVREISVYDLQELQNGQQFFDPANDQSTRAVFRKVFDLGPKVAGGTYTIATGITRLSNFTRIYGTCTTAVVDYRPLPYVDTASVTNQISITIVPAGASSNLVVQVGATSPNITNGIVVLEYILA